MGLPEPLADVAPERLEPGLRFWAEVRHEAYNGCERQSSELVATDNIDDGAVELANALPVQRRGVYSRHWRRTSRRWASVAR